MSDPLTPEERARLRSKFDKNLDAGLVEPSTHRDIVRLLDERDRLEQERDAIDDVCVRAIAHLHALGHLAAAHELRKMRRKAKAATHPAEEPEEPPP